MNIFNLSLLRKYFGYIAYPPGAIFTTSADMSLQDVIKLYGGTWEQIKGKFLFAAEDSGEYAMGQPDGGSKDAIVVSHNHSLGGHAFSWGDGSCTVSAPNASAVGGYSGNNALCTKQGSWNYTNSSGSSGTGKNMPPYTIVKMFRRISLGG